MMRGVELIVLVNTYMFRAAAARAVWALEIMTGLQKISKGNLLEMSLLQLRSQSVKRKHCGGARMQNQKENHKLNLFHAKRRHPSFPKHHRRHYG